MLTVIYARALPDIRVNAVAPGFTATELTDHRRTQTPIEGSDAMVALATIGTDTDRPAPSRSATASWPGSRFPDRCAQGRRDG